MAWLQGGVSVMFVAYTLLFFLSERPRYIIDCCWDQKALQCRVYAAFPQGAPFSLRFCIDSLARCRRETVIQWICKLVLSTEGSVSSPDSHQHDTCTFYHALQHACLSNGLDNLWSCSSITILASNVQCTANMCSRWIAYAIFFFCLSNRCVRLTASV